MALCCERAGGEGNRHVRGLKPLTKIVTCPRRQQAGMKCLPALAAACFDMAEHSKIEWTDATWNPVRGCTKISQGCKNCYAEAFAERFRGVKGHPYEFGFDLRLVPEKLAEPLRWREPEKIFVNSMSDLFHEAVPDSYIEQVVRVMLDAPWHIYQVLTKRAQRLASFVARMSAIR